MNGRFLNRGEELGMLQRRWEGGESLVGEYGNVLWDLAETSPKRH
jgi:hypothetical protein